MQPLFNVSNSPDSIQQLFFLLVTDFFLIYLFFIHLVFIIYLFGCTRSLVGACKLLVAACGV